MMMDGLTKSGQLSGSVGLFSRMHVPRNVAAMKTLDVVTATIRIASNTLYVLTKK